MAFTCPDCGAVSHNPNDERERYCGRCHAFVEDRYENPMLYDLARQICHASGLPWRDPRTGVVYPPPEAPPSADAVDPGTSPTGENA